jgi:hypothetical protein
VAKPAASLRCTTKPRYRRGHLREVKLKWKQTSGQVHASVVFPPVYETFLILRCHHVRVVLMRAADSPLPSGLFVILSNTL